MTKAGPLTTAEADSELRYGGSVLLDNSAWVRLGLGRLDPADQRRFHAAVRADEIVACPPFALEAIEQCPTASSRSTC